MEDDDLRHAISGLLWKERIEFIGMWVVGVAMIAAIVYVWSYGPRAVWYAVEYKIPPARVFIDPQPSDCEFWHAPLGYKGCHYEAFVFVTPTEPKSVIVVWEKK